MPAPQVTGEKGVGALPEQGAKVAQAWPCSTEQSSSAERSHPRPPCALPTTSLVCSHLLSDCRLLELRPPCPRPTATWLTRCPCAGPSCLAGKADPVWLVWVQVEREGAAEPSPLQGSGHIATTTGRALCSQEALPGPEGDQNRDQNRDR